MSRLAALLVLGALASTATGQEDWSARKNRLREVFQKAHEGTLEEPGAGPDGAPAAGPTGRGPEGPAGPSIEEVQTGLRRSVVELFQAYEREDVSGFMGLVDPSFAMADRSGNSYTFALLPQSLAEDFRALTNLQFVVQVGTPSVELAGGLAQVDVRWSRRSSIENGGQEWILLDQRSVFRFVRGTDGRWRISAIFGDPIFALATTRGEILVTEGTIDGTRVTTPLVLDPDTTFVVEEPPPPAGPAFNAPITGTFSFDFARFDLDSQTLDKSCEAAGAFDVDVRCSNSGEINVGVAGLPGGIQFLGFVGLDSIRELPESGYGSDPILLTVSPSDIGIVVAVLTTDGKYAAFEITNFQFVGASLEYTIRFKYQTDGSRKLAP